jgi:hypothetical protein
MPMAVVSELFRDISAMEHIGLISQAARRNGLTVDRWAAGMSDVSEMITAGLGGVPFAWSRSQHFPLGYEIGDSDSGSRVIWSGVTDDLHVSVGDDLLPVSVLPIMRATDEESRKKAVNGVTLQIAEYAIFEH